MSYRKINNVITGVVNTIDKFPTLIRENEAGFIRSESDSSIHRSTWSRSTLIPAETLNASVGETGTNRWSGQMQIDIFTPTGQGSDEADYFADAIVSALPERVFLDVPDETWKLHIKTVSRVIGQTSTNYYMVPVIIQFEAYIQR